MGGRSGEHHLARAVRRALPHVRAMQLRELLERVGQQRLLVVLALHAARPAAAAAENASNITLFEIVSQICRVEMEVEIYHLLESDDNATRYKASENLSRSLHSFRTLVQVFTLAFGEEEEGGEDNIGDISKGFPRKRICDPAQMDSTLLFLVSPSSECVTGTFIKIDDGQGTR